MESVININSVSVAVGRRRAKSCKANQMNARQLKEGVQRQIRRSRRICACDNQQGKQGYRRANERSQQPEDAADEVMGTENAKNAETAEQLFLMVSSRGRLPITSRRDTSHWLPR